MWAAIQKWFQSKGGVAHVIAATYLFLLAAYGMVQPFHQFVQHMYQILPGWAEELAAAVIGLAGFYKTWKASNSLAASPEPPKAS